MKQVSVLAVALLFTTPVFANEDGEMSEGIDLLGQGMQLLFKGLLDEMEPALRDLGGAIEGLNSYHPPEVLPNGDIIIRRKTPIAAVPGEGEVDL